MKKSFKKYLSLVMVLMVAFVCLFSVSVKAADTTTTKYTFSSYTAGTQYAKNEEHILDDTLTIYTTESHFTSELRIYSSSTHNGYVIGKSSKKITKMVLNAGNNSDTIVVYGSVDGDKWTSVSELSVAKSYKDYTVNEFNYKWFKLDVKGTNQVRVQYMTVTYEEAAESADVTNAKEAVNAVKAYMSMGFNFSYEFETKEAANVVDTLNPTLFGTSGSYSNWSDKKDQSSAVYTGNSMTGTGSNSGALQLRSKNSNSGIVTTISGGTALSVSVTWHSSATSGALQVYGSNTPYSAATDLYSSATQGDLLGKIAFGSTDFTITGDYKYIGVRSESGAIYLNNIKISWAGESYSDYSFENSEFRIRCGIDASVEDIANIDSFGIQVSAGNQTKKYTDENVSWAYDEVKDIYYVVISLGDVLTEMSRLDVKFTVEAFVVVEDITCVSTSTKTHSVVSLVETYYADVEAKEHVAELYDILVDMGKIK